MRPSDEIKQIQNFQDELHALIDRYLKEGIHPRDASDILSEEASSDLYGRQLELDAE